MTVNQDLIQRYYYIWLGGKVIIFLFKLKDFYLNFEKDYQ